MWLLALLIIVPIVEIALFIQVGGAIGLWPTLAIVVLTAIAGSILLRSQGVATINRLRNSMADGTNPVDPMAHGAMILVAGVLMLTPGFFTDAVGFLLLLPPVRRWLITAGAARMAGRTQFVYTDGQNFGSDRGNMRPGPAPAAANDDTITTDYSVVDDQTPSEPGSSGWTRNPPRGE